MHGIMKGCLTAGMLVVMTAAEQEFRMIFDGKSGSGWILCDKTPLSKDHVRADGLNPHGTGSYLVVHETQRRRLRARLRLQAIQRLQFGRIRAHERLE